MYGEKSMSVSNSAAEGDPQSVLREDMEALKNDFAALRDDILKIGSKKAADASDKIDEQISEAREHASSLFAAADQETRAAAESIQKNVRENPVASLSAAVAIGFLLGRTVFRK